jgi:hypothetical protein
MNPGTAFLLGFGTCLIFLIASLILGSQVEKSPTPSEENNCSFLVLAYRPFLLPESDQLLDRDEESLAKKRVKRRNAFKVSAGAAQGMTHFWQ